MQTSARNYLKDIVKRLESLLLLGEIFFLSEEKFHKNVVINEL